MAARRALSLTEEASTKVFVVSISQLLNKNTFAYSINLHMHRVEFGQKE